MMPAGERRDDIVVVHDEQNEQIVPRNAHAEQGMDVAADDAPSTDEALDDEPIGDEQIADERAAAEPISAAEPVAAPSPGADDAWPAVQALFVDDPRLAVERAAKLTSDALSALEMAARQREQLVRAGWESGEADTEELRTALRGYRDLAGRLNELASEF
jgi:hypothetical protein